MPNFFSRLKGKDGPTKASKKKGEDDVNDQVPAKPTWTDAWTRTTVEPEEIQNLVRGCTVELKSRGMKSDSEWDITPPPRYRLCTKPRGEGRIYYGVCVCYTVLICARPCSFGYAIPSTSIPTYVRSKCGTNIY